MKAKNWIVCAILVIAGFCLFGCKETSVEAESISFEQKSINLLVGDSYFPEVKVLPSYATNKSYTLISGDITALKVEGLKIVGLKAMKGVSLKVVSNENSNLNDVIIVNIFEETVDLSAPEGQVGFNGTDFYFNAVDNAYGYVLKVEGNGFSKELNIGNNTTYSWKMLEENMGRSLKDEICRYSVKAVGDGMVYNDSPYTQGVKFVNCSSPENAQLVGTILKFTSIKNILQYTIEVKNVKSGASVSKTIDSTSQKANLLTCDLAEIIDFEQGGEYSVVVAGVKDSYCQDVSNVFVLENLKYNFNVLGKVKNLTINNRIISWDLIDNAQSYDVVLYKDGSVLKGYSNLLENKFEFNYEDAGNYSCKIIACSTDKNVVSNINNYSQELLFSVLSAPTVEANENLISWANLDGAEGYLVYIKDKTGTEIVSKKFVIANSSGNIYDVSKFEAGEYFIEVQSFGNGTNVISSKKSNEINWKILNEVQNIKVENQKLIWEDTDVNSKNIYNIVVSKDDVDYINQTVSNADIGVDYTKNDSTFTFDLTKYSFDEGNYSVKLQNVGEGDVFSSKINTTQIIKLAESEILNISSGTIFIKPVQNAVSYLVKIYGVADTEFVNPIFELEVKNNKATLNISELEAGKYIARVFTYGKDNVFDANNNVEVTGKLEFEKLSTPNLILDKENFKISVESMPGAERYILIENDREKDFSSGEYDISSLQAGDYQYKVKAVGNNADILNSEFTLDEQSVKVKQIKKPTISFDKQALSFAIECEDDEYVNEYQFLINETSVTVVKTEGQYVVDCSSIITSAGEYLINLKALAKVDANVFIIGAEIKTETVNKLDAGTTVEVDNGKLIVNVNSSLIGTGYSLQLRIKNLNNEELILNEFDYSNGVFKTDLYDDEFNIKELKNEFGVQFFNKKDTYTLFATISSDKQDIVVSNEQEADNKIFVLDKVNNIIRDAQNIEFNDVENATNYMAYLTRNGKTYYFDIDSIVENPHILKVEDLLSTMYLYNVEYVEGELYTIGFIAKSTDTKYVFGRSEEINNYSFEFLKKPQVEIVELEDNAKFLMVRDASGNASNFSLELNQGDIVKSGWYSFIDGEEDVKINLADFSQFISGNIEIKVKSKASTGNYFESGYSELVATKLSSADIVTENGILVWDEIANAKQYNLFYTKNGETLKIELLPNSNNFTIENGKCKYDFDDLDSGLVTFYLQVDAVEPSAQRYYLNSNNGNKIEDVYKMSKIDIVVENGILGLQFRRKDWESADRIEVLLDGDLITTSLLETLTSAETEGDLVTLKLEGTELLKYPSLELLTKEKFEIKYYSNKEKVLNSQATIKDVAGLLSPIGLDITTSTTLENEAIKEVFEKITWKNPVGNINFVDYYEVVINYNENDYIYYTANSWMMMPKFDDKNSNGVLDEDEVKFGAGIYKIKVRAITINQNNNYVLNSRPCDEIQVTVLETPTDLATLDGNITWKENISAEYFLVRIYLIQGSEKTLITSTKTKGNENVLDLTLLQPLVEGVYSVTVQAMHDGLKVLTSEESEELQVIRLPQVQSYYIKEGKLWVKAHSFYNEIQIYLRNAENGEYLKDDLGNPILFNIKNANLESYDNFVKDMTSWSASNILETYTSNEYIIDVMYQDKIGNSTLEQAIAGGYKLDIKLIGNSKQAGAIISGQVAVDVRNSTMDVDLVKLEEPSASVSETVVGQFNFGTKREYKNLQYFGDGETYLSGVYLYEVIIQADIPYVMLVAQIFDNDLFSVRVPSVEQDDVEKHNLKHFNYGGYCFNVLDNLSIDFTQDEYYYYTANGEYSWIKFNQGGSFIINVRLIGDDTYFAESNYSDAVNIYRYRVLNLTVKDGKISWLNQASEEDKPIYIITLTSSTAEYNIVLYNPDVQSLESIQGGLDEGKQYKFDTITYTLEDEFIVYTGLADIIGECVGNKLGGTYTANIKAYHTEKTSTNKLLAQGTVPATITVLPEVQLSIEDGKLNWNQAYVSKTGGNDYIVNYELEIEDSDGNKFVKLLKDGDYKLTNYVASYELPEAFVSEDETQFAFDSNKTYTFRLRTMSGENLTYVNSTNSQLAEVELLPTLNVEMKGGLLTWENPTTNSVIVNISYQSGKNLVVVEMKINSNSFDLPKMFTDIYGTSGEFTADFDYQLKARLSGGNSKLNGFYSNIVDVNRLEAINTDSIVTKNGVLTWDKSSVEGSTYKVVYTTGELTSASVWKESEMLENPEFDFAVLNTGKITAYVQVYNDTYFKSFESGKVELYKLDIPTNITFIEESTTITWDKVIDNNGVEIDNYKVKIMQEGMDDLGINCTTNSWVIEGVSLTTFKIAVMALGSAENDGIINSNYTEFVTMEQPNSVNQTTFVFNSDLNRFEWNSIEGEEITDKYYIGYNYYTDGDSLPVKHFELVNSYTNIDGVKTYYYRPNKIGSYRQIYVQVVRAGSLSSQATYCVTETGNFVLDFNVFASGDGQTAETAYIIQTETHLRNVKYFLNAYYKIASNIDLKLTGGITGEDEVFSGKIDGQNYYITNYIATDSVFGGYSGLFARTLNAEFKDINISGFTVNGELSTQTLYLGVLVGQATDTTFNDIIITDGGIKFNGYSESSNSINIYIGGLAGSVTGCNITACEVVITGNNDSVSINMTGRSTARIYVGGIAGRWDNSSATDLKNVKFNIKRVLMAVETQPPYIYIGGLIGLSMQSEPNLINCSGETAGVYYLYISSAQSEENVTKIGKIA